jgi:hypothetical protein
MRAVSTTYAHADCDMRRYVKYYYNYSSSEPPNIYSVQQEAREPSPEFNERVYDLSFIEMKGNPESLAGEYLRSYLMQ